MGNQIPIDLLSLELDPGGAWSTDATTGNPAPGLGRRVFANLLIGTTRARRLVYLDDQGRVQVQGLEARYPVLSPKARDLLLALVGDRGASDE